MSVEVRTLSWRSSLLGAAVGIGGPAYTGTLISNVTVLIYLRQGLQPSDAYARLGEFTLDVHQSVALIADVIWAILSGWVSTAYGSGKPLLQGLTAGLMAGSFPLIMTFGPLGSTMPTAFFITGLAVPVFGSVLGAYACVLVDRSFRS